jgi:hypothetical protein
MRIRFSPPSGRLGVSPGFGGGPGSGLYPQPWRNHLAAVAGQRFAEREFSTGSASQFPRPIPRVYAIIEAKEGGIYRSRTAANIGPESMMMAGFVSAPGISAKFMLIQRRSIQFMFEHRFVPVGRRRQTFELMPASQGSSWALDWSKIRSG